MQGSQVVVDVNDTGKGLDAVRAEHLFDPFYTTKKEGMGMRSESGGTARRRRAAPHRCPSS